VFGPDQEPTPKANLKNLHLAAARKLDWASPVRIVTFRGLGLSAGSPVFMERKAGSLRGRLLRTLALMLAIPADCWPARSAYWNARAAADTAYDDRSLLVFLRGQSPSASTMRTASLWSMVPYTALDNFGL